jgi:hypothetical protein
VRRAGRARGRARGDGERRHARARVPIKRTPPGQRSGRKRLERPVELDRPEMMFRYFLWGSGGFLVFEPFVYGLFSYDWVYPNFKKIR